MKPRASSLIVILLVAMISMIGTLGYHFIEGWGLHDSFYMTVITLTTTGFQEVHNLSPEGRTFTVFLLIVGMGVVAYSISTIMQDILSINFSVRRRRKMEKGLKKLRDHAVICGFGRMGKVICKELAQHGKEFVVLEKCQELLSDLEMTDYKWIAGDATHDENLIKAGIERANVLVSMVDNDADNLYLSLAGRSLNQKLYIIARANDESARPKILRAGADKVILPIIMSGVKVAQSVINPAVDDLLDIAGISFGENKRIQVAEIGIKSHSSLVGKSLLTCGFKRDGLIVVGIKNEANEFVFAPRADYLFREGDCLITISTQESYAEIVETYSL